MLTLDESWLAAVGLDPRRDVRGTVGLAGPYDFYPFTDEKTAEVFASALDPHSTQPIEFVDGNEPPMLLATGLDDDTVRPRNTFRLAERIRAQGGRAEVRTYPGVGHIKLIAALAEPLRSPDLPVLDDVVGFLDGIDGHAAERARGAPRVASAHR
jgi:acetyl esterase/lipase